MHKKIYLNASADWTAADINTKGFTHIILAFAHISNDFTIRGRNTRLRAGAKSDIPTPGYECAIPRDKWPEIAKLKEQNPDLKIIVSVGGWAAEGFSDMAASYITREIFTDSCAKYLETHNLDGIDIDWEYPTVNGRGYIKTRPADRRNFTLLLSSLRSKIGKGKELTYCAAPGVWFADAIELLETTRFADGIHLMTYDFSGAWSTQTRHHTNLFKTEGDPDPHAESTEICVNRYLDAGVPAQMLFIGCAGYGKEFRGMTVFEREELPGLFFKFLNKDPHIWPGGIITYDILNRHYIDKNGYKRLYDDTAAAYYLYSDDEKTFISYDDPQAIKDKTAYARKNSLGGVFGFEYTHGAKSGLWDAMK